jgi:chemotaxis protein methyltransferase CheR
MACSDADYAYLRSLVQAQSSNLIAPSRNSLFETRLTPVARLAGVSNLEGLVSLLKEDTQADLHRAVAEAMTINETSFFRDVSPFEMLRETILPRLVEQRAAERTLRIWSAASSSGQEAYSLAMMIAEHFPALAEWDVKIIGTDISRQVVEYAKKAKYRRLEVNRGLPARLLLKYFQRNDEEWEICARVRDMCEFAVANLCDRRVRLPVFDLVLLRNVLLYFPQQERRNVFGQVHQKLAQDGYLVLGNSEQAEDSTDLFEVEFTTQCYFYRPIIKR